MDRDTSAAHSAASRWLVPGQETPPSSAERFYGTPVKTLADTSKDGPKDMEPAPPDYTAEAAVHQMAKEAATDPRPLEQAAKKAIAEAAPAPPPHAGASAGKSSSRASAKPAVSDKKHPTSRKAFVKSHRPRMHKTGPQPKLADYEGDIRKMLKKGYAAADIYHWLHDFRGEEISIRSVQRFVRMIQKQTI